MTDIISSLFNGLEQGIINPKGDMGDYSHASKLFTTNNYAFAPKVKFLYHVVFHVDPSVTSNGAYTSQLNTVVGMLVKAVDLPKYKISVDTVHQYNRKKQLQSKLEYDPINIVFHDDNTGATTGLWQMYFNWYFADMKNANLNNTAGYASSSAYTGSAFAPKNQYYQYGMDNNVTTPFFKSVDIYQLSRHQWFMYSLVNPLITSWQHDNIENSSSEPVQSTMTLTYETVLMNSGLVSVGSPPGFATEYYDNTPSPLGISGGGTNALFGSNGLIGGATGLLSSLANGSAFSNPLGTIIQGANLFNNASKLSSASLQEQGFNLLTGTLTSATGVNIGGVANTLFPTASNSQVPVTNAINKSPPANYSNSTTNATTTFTNNFQSNPAAYSTAITNIANFANIPGIPTNPTDFNSLSSQAQSAAVDTIMNQYNSGNPKVVGLINQYSQLSPQS